MKFTIAAITDEYGVECFGQFSHRQDAEGTAAKLDMRTNAGKERGDEDYVRFRVCLIQRVKDFKP